MKVRVIDEDGATSVIDNDLEPAEAVSEEVRRFIDRTKRSRDGPVTLDSLGSGFLIDLYVRTSVRRVEPVSEAEPGRDRTGIRWNQVRERYNPPAGSAVGDGARGVETGGGVSRGDDPTPDASTQSPRPGRGE